MVYGEATELDLVPRFVCRYSTKDKAQTEMGRKRKEGTKEGTGASLLRLEGAWRENVQLVFVVEPTQDHFAFPVNALMVLQLSWYFLCLCR